MTELQNKMLVFIGQYIGERGYSPSYVEIGQHLGLTSKSNINRLANALVDRGLLVREPGKVRTLVPTSVGHAALRLIPTAELRAELARREEAARC